MRKLLEKTLLWAGLGLSILALVVLLFSFLHPIERGEWNPLADYHNPQKVTNGPVIHLTDTVNITGTKCADAPARVRGTKFWQSEDVHGYTILDGYGVGDRTVGCVTKHYMNVIPAAVAQAVRTGGPKVWHIEGTDTPIRDNGVQGVPRTWVTDPFMLAP